MKITIEYRNPTPSHCDMAVFINGALTGTLRLGQEDIGGFHQIIAHGCAKGIDTFISRGSLTPSGSATEQPVEDR